MGMEGSLHMAIVNAWLNNWDIFGALDMFAVPIYSVKIYD